MECIVSHMMPLNEPIIGQQMMPNNVSITVGKKQHTLKNTVMSLPNKLIVFLGRTFSGHHHDYLMLKQELPPELDWFADINVRVDLGYLARIIHKIAVSLYKSLFYNEHAENRSCNDLQETTMTQDTQIVLPFASLSGKRLQADFDGGALSSDGGVLFLRETEAHIGVMRRFVEALDDRRDPRYTEHRDEELCRERIFQIACGYEDANDGDSLRRDPAFKAACERLPIVGEDLASQPTMSRLDTAPRRSELYRMAQALLETFVASYARPPKALLLAIDATA